MIRDSHISPILQGVEAQVCEEALVYAVFVAAKALVLLGAIATSRTLGLPHSKLTSD